MTNKNKKLLIVLLITITSIFTLILIKSNTKQNVKKQEVEVSEKPVLPKGKYSPSLKLRNNPYLLHKRVCKKSGIKVIQNFNEIPSYVKSGKLVKITNGQGYVVQKLTHSKPYLNKKSAKMLRQIGQQFYADTDAKAFFTVTSLTRSNNSQKKLRKRNINAIRGISTHCYGASFDISYMRFNGVKEWNDPLKVKLELILAKLQKEKKIYVLREKKSACYHITAR